MKGGAAPTKSVEATYSERGPWEVTKQQGFGCCDSSGHKFDVWYPTDLGADGTTAKIMTLLSLIAALNMALFVFNLIPLLPLDGGHVAGALWEGLKRNGARILGRSDPGHVDVAKALPVAYTMALVLITMSALLIYADIVKPVKLF